LSDSLRAYAAFFLSPPIYSNPRFGFARLNPFFFCACLGAGFYSDSTG
jgi:hypothetical protein